MDDEKDSLFGSPPPSPERGRSPSLALPEDAGWRMEDALLHTQNVGTIALLGSQNNLSKIPVQPVVSSNRPFLRLRPPSIEPTYTPTQHVQPPPTPTPTHRSKTMTTVPSLSHPKPLARKHSDRMDRTLSDLVSLIAHFSPAQSLQLPPQMNANQDASQEGTKENPIQVDDMSQDHPPTPIDAVNNALIALANTVASALKLPNSSLDHPPLSEPAVHKVLQFIKHDPKLIPTLQATHEYLNNVPHHPPSYEISCPDNYANPSKSRRKRKQVTPRIPAGAEHWDVPFPFAPGHEPKGYPTQWQLERGRRVLGELLGLFERAFVHCRTKEPLTRCTSMGPPAKRARLSSVETNRNRRSTDIQVNQSTSASCLDSQRMSEWLSSLYFPFTESIVDSSSTHPPSSAISSGDFSLDDISNIMDIFPVNVVAPSQPSTLDFTQLFDNFDWHSLDSIPVSGSPAMSAPIQDVDMVPTYMGMDIFPPSDPISGYADPEATAIATSNAPERQGSLESTFHLDLDAAESMFTSYFPSSHAQPICGIAQSTQTIPTASGSSSVREGTPLASTRPESISNDKWSKNTSSTQLQRKLSVLLKAQDYRNYLLGELETTALKKWQLRIESGVLQNLKSAVADLS